MVKTEVVLHEEGINYIKLNKLQLDSEGSNGENGSCFT